MRTSKKTVKVDYEETTQSMFTRLMSITNDYLTHQYQIANDKHAWKEILFTAGKYGTIFHMDYSENISGAPMHESQSSHFNKNQYFLHCAVGHNLNENNEVTNTYYHHLSDGMRHDYAFTGHVIEELIANANTEVGQLEVIRLKSDNCSSQYKSKRVFMFYQQLAEASGKVIIVYCGVAGNGKDIVDAMSSFGAKDPLRKEIVRNDFWYTSSLDIYNLLVHKKSSVSMMYFHIPTNILEERRNTDETIQGL